MAWRLRSGSPRAAGAARTIFTPVHHRLGAEVSGIRGARRALDPGAPRATRTALPHPGRLALGGDTPIRVFGPGSPRSTRTALLHPGRLALGGDTPIPVVGPGGDLLTRTVPHPGR